MTFNELQRNNHFESFVYPEKDTTHIYICSNLNDVGIRWFYLLLILYRSGDGVGALLVAGYDESNTFVEDIRKFAIVATSRVVPSMCIRYEQPCNAVEYVTIYKVINYR